ncbi:DUF4458 domain-containing protein [Bacteroides eggerthii]|uniref:DUF4458 domain-containing protein n=1 Tax=Bacteroides eggerthii TaxID=28111 RepID=UPI00356869F6
MKSERITICKLLLVSFITMISGMVIYGCSDEKDELQGSQYGYVQFKLYKSSSYIQEEVPQSNTPDTRAAIDRLGEAQKIEIEMQYNGKSIIQTLVLNAYDENNAEYGMRSDKLQLLVGEYKVVSCKLLDKLDNVVSNNISVGANEVFTVVSRGLTVKDLITDAQARGTVTFKLIKSGLPTRATGEGDTYLFSDIKLIDVMVTNTFTHVSREIKGLKVVYKEESEEHVNEDNPNDKYMDTGVAFCDSAVWLPAGTYRVTSYSTYKKNGSMVSPLETQPVQGEIFTIEDNQEKKDAIIPIKLSSTAEYIKDYIALKEIWKALGGENWNFYGFGSGQGRNWNFNKEIDMWGNQPGVELDSKGRVTGLSLEGFGANGRVPDAIGQLTELRVLALGTHGEQLTPGRLFGTEGISANMSDAQKQKMRMHYKEAFLDYDPRENLSELLQSSINSDPTQKPIKKSNRIQLKDTQIGHFANNITFVSQAVKRLTNLQQFYMANSPFTVDDICTDWENKDSEYAKQYELEPLSWSSLKELTDIEIYNCPNMTELPQFLFELPELQVLNIACNPQIEDLQEEWSDLIDGGPGKKLQILYMGYNSLEQFPENVNLMTKLGFLDCTFNKLKGKLKPFGTDVQFTTLKLDYNEIEEIPEQFCAFTDQVENLGFSHNKLKYIPNIFNAASVYVMGAVDFSYNQIGSDTDKNNIKPDGQKFRGINASTIDLSNNQISKFPKELFEAGSPINTLNLSGNLLKEIPKYSMRSENGNYKNTHMLNIIDLRFNQLTSLSDDFRATTLPYLTNMDVSYNCFSKFPTEPLNSSQLRAFGIRHQRDAKGNRILKEWPEGITSIPSLLQLQIGSNDIRKVTETLNPKVWIMEIKDNPNISIDLTSVCPYIEAGVYKLIYDKTQDIRGCDALDIKR